MNNLLIRVSKIAQSMMTPVDVQALIIRKNNINERLNNKLLIYEYYALIENRGMTSEHKKFFIAENKLLEKYNKIIDSINNINNTNEEHRINTVLHTVDIYNDIYKNIMKYKKILIEREKAYNQSSENQDSKKLNIKDINNDQLIQEEQDKLLLKRKNINFILYSLIFIINKRYPKTESEWIRTKNIIYNYLIEDLYIRSIKSIEIEYNKIRKSKGRSQLDFIGPYIGTDFASLRKLINDKVSNLEFKYDSQKEDDLETYEPKYKKVPTSKFISYKYLKYKTKYLELI